MKLFPPFWQHIKGRLNRKNFEKRGFVQPRNWSDSFGKIAELTEKSHFVWMFVISAVWLVSVLALVYPVMEANEPELVIGQVSPFTYYAERDFSYIDEKKTELERQKARQNEPEIFKINAEASESTVKLFSDFIEELSKRIEAGKKEITYKAKDGDKASEFVASLSEESLNTLSLLTYSEEKKKVFINEVEILVNQGIIPQNYLETRDTAQKIQIVDIIDSKVYLRKVKDLSEIPTIEEAALLATNDISRNFSIENREKLKACLNKEITAILSPTLVYDAEATELNRDKAAKAVEPAKINVRKGDIVIGKSSTVNRESYNRYKAYLREKQNIIQSEKVWKKAINYAAICLLLMILNGLYIGHIHPEVIRDNKLVALIGTVVIITIITNTAVFKLFSIFSAEFSLPPVLLSSILPIEMASMILSVMIGLRVGIYSGLFVSLIAAIQLDNSFQTLLTGMVVSAVAGFSVRHSPNHRAYYLRGAFAVIISIPLMGFLNLWYIGEKFDIIVNSAVLGLANGMVTAAMSLALIFILETVFRASTDMSLLLLCDYNHPLLKKLQLEAPGTYHHSLVVSTLAEQAAQEIGANPIRARVCALFHDIGKLETPAYFTENDLDNENKHEDLNPRISSLVILNHVKEGINLAKKYKLRKVIRDAIEQHHGTDLVHFFYQRAVEEGRSKECDITEGDYRYPGPLPREKEVVIVSLADACEAASRTLSKPTPAKIDSLIGEILRKRIRDGQLDNANLTFGELSRIRKSFTRTLSQMLHGRISYPKPEEGEENAGDLFKEAAKVSGAGKEIIEQNGEKSR